MSLEHHLPDLEQGLIEVDGRFEVVWAARAVGESVWELALALTNPGSSPITVTRADPLAATLPSGEWSTLHFTAGWGAEFEPQRGSAFPIDLEARSGRSSNGVHPWLALSRADETIVVSPAWSGNWHIDVDRERRLTAGIAPRDFATIVPPGGRFEAPSVFVSIGKTVDAAASALASVVGRDILARSVASDAVPVEWNHWWPYEDAEIDERVFLANADAARPLGFEVATLDAGWFGSASAASDWQLERGDWNLVNSERFPSGLPDLATRVRAAGLQFGIWMEAEAVGSLARLRTEHPDLIAVRTERALPDEYPNGTVSLDAGDPSFLGYVCLGSEAGRRHVAASLDSAVVATGATWLKLDFNVDPGAGCSRVDHGHGAGDGLYAHYRGLYSVLDDFRARHPEVILEACSSGGLRIDLGLAPHVHCFFLSDPDWTEHHLQVLWGASLMLPPAAMLHWSWSEWRGDNPNQDVDFADLPAAEFDAMLRAAMLQRFGVSLRLPDLRPELAERLREHVSVFRELLAPLVADGTLHRLTDQPLRHGRGERTPQLQLSLGDRHVTGAFVLAGGEAASVRFTALDTNARYTVTALADSDAGSTIASGAELMSAGWTPPYAAPSWLVLAEASPVPVE